MEKINTFIISYNRLSFLKQQVEFFQRIPELNIIIVDNGSTYPPLREYLEYIRFGEDVCVSWLGNNYGHTVIWDKKISTAFSPNEPYIVTDNDVIPEDINFHELLLEGLKEFPYKNKIGLGLRTDDIPSTHLFKDQIIKHECDFLHKDFCSDSRFIGMPVDTTLAMYRGGFHKYEIWNALRTTQSLAKHLSWYITEEEMKNEENRFYFNSLKTGSTHWSVLQAKSVQSKKDKV